MLEAVGLYADRNIQRFARPAGLPGVIFHIER
jgi:hypothetical protein